MRLRRLELRLCLKCEGPVVLAGVGQCRGSGSRWNVGGGSVIDGRLRRAGDDGEREHRAEGAEGNATCDMSPATPSVFAYLSQRCRN